MGEIAVFPANAKTPVLKNNDKNKFFILMEIDKCLKVNFGDLDIED